MAKANQISADKAGFANEVGYKLLLQAAIISLMQDVNKKARTAACLLYTSDAADE